MLFRSDWNRRVYAILLGKTIYGDVSLTDFFEELTQDEVSELTRILTERSDAPPTWADVEEYMRIILHERGFSDPKKVQNASPEELKQYFDELRKQK